jgi:hypothetical protein
VRVAQTKRRRCLTESLGDIEEPGTFAIQTLAECSVVVAAERRKPLWCGHKILERFRRSQPADSPPSAGSMVSFGRSIGVLEGNGSKG